jgi:hypothetical protein
MKILSSKNSFPHKSLVAAIFLAFIASACSSTVTNENVNSANAKQANANSSLSTNSVPTNTQPTNSVATTANAAVGNAPSANNSATTADSTIPPGGGSPPVATDPDIPSEAEQQTLVKTTLLDLDSAIRSGSYESFHSSGSAYFQQQYTPAQLEQRFAELARRKIDLSGISNKQAEIKSAVQNQNGIKVLNINGSYPTNPAITFELQYIQEDIEWKLLELNIK